MGADSTGATRHVFGEIHFAAKKVLCLRTARRVRKRIGSEFGARIRGGPLSCDPRG